MAGKIDCPRCLGTGLEDTSTIGHDVVCKTCKGDGKIDYLPYEAVWIAGAWKAVVGGKMQKPDFNDKGAALAFGKPVSEGTRKAEPFEG